MTNFCPREQDIVNALHRGGLSPEQLAHTAECPGCREVEIVASSLGEDYAALDELPIPDASVVWRRAQARIGEEALERATRPIRWVHRASYVLGTATTVWFLASTPHGDAWATSLFRPWLEIGRGQGLFAASAAALGLVGALLCLLLGSCYLLWEDRAA